MLHAMPHFRTFSVRFTYRNAGDFPIPLVERSRPNGSDSIRIFIMAEKLLDRMRRMIRVKRYGASIAKAERRWVPGS